MNFVRKKKTGYIIQRHMVPNSKTRLKLLLYFSLKGWKAPYSS